MLSLLRDRNVLTLAAALLALVGALTGGVYAVRSWNTETYNRGFEAGSQMVRGQWDDSNAKVMAFQLETIQQDVLRSNEAVKRYLDDIAARKPEILRVKEKVTVYEKTPASTAVCFDADAYRLLQEHRAALGYPSPAEAGNTGAVQGTVPVSGSAAQ